MKKDVKNKSIHLGLVVALVLGIFLSSLISPVFDTVSAADMGWWVDANWDYCKLITIDSTQVDATLTNFPILVQITSDSNLAINAQPDGDDILFTGDTTGISVNETKYNHEIESWIDDGNYVNASIWVNVTSLSSSMDTKIWMYYGNLTCSSQENVVGTWDSNFVMVQHMNDNTTSDILDSTANNNDGTKKAANEPIENSSSKINCGQDFDGINDYISLGTQTLYNDYTIAVWIKFNSLGIDEHLLDANYIRLAYDSAIVDTDDIGFVMYDGTAFRYANVSNGFTSTDTWYYIVGSYESASGEVKIYMDSVLKDTGYGYDGTIGAGSDISGIGSNRQGTANFVHGLFDEIKCSNIARNSSWINASFDSQNQTTGFLTFGGESSAHAFVVTTVINGTVTPVSAVDIDIKLTGTGTIVGSGLTNATGVYVLSNLTITQGYDIVASKVGYTCETKVNKFPSVGGTAITINCTIQAANFTITTYDYDGNPKQNNYIEIRYSTNNTLIETLITNASGTNTSSLLSILEQYHIIFLNYSSFALESRTPPQTINMYEARIRVQNEYDMSPIENVDVFAYRSGYTSIVATGTTNATGYYTFILDDSFEPYDFVVDEYDVGKLYRSDVPVDYNFTVKPKIHETIVVGCQYKKGDNVTIAVALEDTYGVVSTGETVNATIYYPNQTEMINFSLPELVSGLYTNTTTLGASIPYGDYIVHLSSQTFSAVTLFQVVGGQGLPLHVYANTGYSYLPDNNVSVFIVTTDSNGDLVSAVVNISVLYPNATALSVGNAVEQSTGIFKYNFTLPSSASVGTYQVEVNASYSNDTAYDILSFMVDSVSSDFEIDALVAGSPRYANEEVLVESTFTNSEGEAITPDAIAVTIYDSNDNVWDTAVKADFSENPKHIWQYTKSIEANPTTGMYTIHMQATYDSKTSSKSSQFRIATGGPYKVSIDCPSQSCIGQDMTCKITLQDEGESATESTSTVWVDTNNNLIWDVGEPQVSFSKQTLPFDVIIEYVSLNIPSSHPTGLFVVRVITSYAGSSQPDSSASDSVSFYLAIGGAGGAGGVSKEPTDATMPSEFPSTVGGVSMNVIFSFIIICLFFILIIFYRRRKEDK